MIIGIPKETTVNETRVALTPANAAALSKKGCEVIVETGAGIASNYTDAHYVEAGATIESDRAVLFRRAELIVQINATASDELHSTHTLIGMLDPLGNPSESAKLAAQGVTTFAMELIPRISRAQSMDVLSSMATIGGYKAVLLAAAASGQLFPMLMTAAGTLNPARVLIIGAGVAGLQAAATAKRLGAVVEAYDVRPAAREQILSVGAKPIELDLETDASEGKGGYAKEQDADFLKRQQEQMAAVLAQQDIVITTAAIPGAKAPTLVTADMVAQMKPGAVIVDLAAERGGNCELTRAGETVIEQGVQIIGPTNVPATVAQHASQLYGKNIENFLGHLLDDDGQIQLDLEDEIIRDTLVVHQGEVCHPRLRELLGLPETEATQQSRETEEEAA